MYIYSAAPVLGFFRSLTVACQVDSFRKRGVIRVSV